MDLLALEKETVAGGIDAAAAQTSFSIQARYDEGSVCAR